MEKELENQKLELERKKLEEKENRGVGEGEVGVREEKIRRRASGMVSCTGLRKKKRDEGE